MITGTWRATTTSNNRGRPGTSRSWSRWVRRTANSSRCDPRGWRRSDTCWVVTRTAHHNRATSYPSTTAPPASRRCWRGCAERGGCRTSPHPDGTCCWCSAARPSTPRSIRRCSAPTRASTCPSEWVSPRVPSLVAWPSAALPAAAVRSPVRTWPWHPTRPVATSSWDVATSESGSSSSPTDSSSIPMLRAPNQGPPPGPLRAPMRPPPARATTRRTVSRSRIPESCCGRSAVRISIRGCVLQPWWPDTTLAMPNRAGGRTKSRSCRRRRGWSSSSISVAERRWISGASGSVTNSSPSTISIRLFRPPPPSPLLATLPTTIG